MVSGISYSQMSTDLEKSLGYTNTILSGKKHRLFVRLAVYGIVKNVVNRPEIYSENIII